MNQENTRLDEIIQAQSKFQKNGKLNRVLFFDESNNIKKAIIGKGRDNNLNLENLCFVLGGIAIKGRLNFDELLAYVHARQRPSDAKFSFFAFKHTNFEEAIQQSRLKLFFEYLLNKNILIHFSVLHYFYFALTDILDSLIEESDVNQQAAFIFYHELQSDMMEVLYKDFVRLHDVLVKFEFPNIKNELSNVFINEILEMYTDNLCNYDMGAPENFTKELLRQIIKAKREKQNLLFLEDNQPFVISGDVTQDYITRMIDFEDEKIFDNEATITNYLHKLDGDYQTKLNVKFCDSKDYREIQVSDVICGFVARLYNFLGSKTEKEIIDFCLALDVNSDSYLTLHNFFKLMEISEKVSNICFKKIMPMFIEHKFELMYRLITEREHI